MHPATGSAYPSNKRAAVRVTQAWPMRFALPGIIAHLNTEPGRQSQRRIGEWEFDGRALRLEDRWTGGNF